MHLDVLALDLLHGCLLGGVVFPVLVELREWSPNVIHEKLRQFFVRLDDETEEFTVVVVHNITKFFLEWERLEVFPSLIFCFEDVYSVLELVYFLGLSWHELLVFLKHAT